MDFADIKCKDVFSLVHRVLYDLIKILSPEIVIYLSKSLKIRYLIMNQDLL